MSFVRKSGKYKAQININSRNKSLGEYYTPEEAFYVYKVAKESNAKRLADKWKGEIEDQVYEAMYRWEILITD